VRMNQRVCSVYAPTSLPSRYNYVYGNLELRESRTPSKMGFLGARMTDKNEIFHMCGRSGEITRFFHLEFMRVGTAKNEAHLHVGEIGGGLGGPCAGAGRRLI
jgi:hypothetical protein